MDHCKAISPQGPRETWEGGPSERLQLPFSKSPLAFTLGTDLRWGQLGAQGGGQEASTITLGERAVPSQASRGKGVAGGWSPGDSEGRATRIGWQARRGGRGEWSVRTEAKMTTVDSYPLLWSSLKAAHHCPHFKERGTLT